MTELLNSIESFFREYERNSASLDFSAVVSQFADPFLAAGPQGASVVTAGDFAAALPARKRLFESMGYQSTALVSLQQIPLSARYILVRTQWRLKFTGSDKCPKEIVANSAFLVDTGEATFKIALYLTNEDMMAALRSQGILAG